MSKDATHLAQLRQVVNKNIHIVVIHLAPQGIAGEREKR
jgi:hypothetical protein